MDDQQVADLLVEYLSADPAQGPKLLHDPSRARAVAADVAPGDSALQNAMLAVTGLNNAARILESGTATVESLRLLVSRAESEQGIRLDVAERAVAVLAAAFRRQPAADVLHWLRSTDSGSKVRRDSATEAGHEKTGRPGAGRAVVPAEAEELSSGLDDGQQARSAWWKRAPLLVGVGVGVLAVVIASAVALSGSGKGPVPGSSRSRPGPTGSSTSAKPTSGAAGTASAGQLTADERALVSRLPSSFVLAASCRSFPAEKPGYMLASVQCNTSSATASPYVFFATQYRSVPVMKYDVDVRAVLKHVREGSCRTPPARATWTDGMLYCYSSTIPGLQMLSWTYERDAIEIHVYGKSARPLYDWWTRADRRLK